MVAVVTLLRILARMSKWGKRVIRCWKFYHFAIRRGSLKVTALTFLVKNGKMTLSESLYFKKTRKNLKSNLVLGVVLVLEYKDLPLRKMYKVIPAPSYTRLLRPPHQFGYF